MLGKVGLVCNRYKGTEHQMPWGDRTFGLSSYPWAGAQIPLKHSLEKGNSHSTSKAIFQSVSHHRLRWSVGLSLLLGSTCLPMTCTCLSKFHPNSVLGGDTGLILNHSQHTPFNFQTRSVFLCL